MTFTVPQYHDGTRFRHQEYDWAVQEITSTFDVSIFNEAAAGMAALGY